jgi:serine/threonine protein kinase
MIGKTFGHYKVVEKLGAGGMGVVYKAQDLHLDRFVALKILPPEKVADAERKRRFVQEAKAASALNHPNIIHIYDIASADNIDFIAMEYVAGETLGRRIGRKGLKMNAALGYADRLTMRGHGEYLSLPVPMTTFVTPISIQPTNRWAINTCRQILAI